MNLTLRLRRQYALIFALFSLTAAALAVLTFSVAARLEGDAARRAGQAVLRDALTDQLRGQAEALAGMLVEQLDEDFEDHDLAKITAVLHGARRREGVALAYVADHNGRPIADTAEAEQQINSDHRAELVRHALLTGAEQKLIADHRVDLAWLIRQEGRPTGVLRLSYDLSLVTTELARLDQQVEKIASGAANRAVSAASLSAALAGLLGVLGGGWVARRLVRPINQLSRYAQKIGRDPDGAGPPPFRRPDELGDLAEAMALMAATLSARETALRGAKEAADHAARAKSSFLATISHEIRTPINAILGMGHLLEEAGLSERQSVLVGRLRAAARTLADLVNDILDFSKVEAGKLVLERTPFDLRRVIDGALDLVRTRAEEKGLILAASLAPDTPTALIGDPLRLGQILTNLLSNAVKFTDRGSVRVMAEALTVAEERATLLLTVIDDGCGMTPEQAERIFDAFAQADASTSRRYGGVGLGLSIVTRFVEAMGGAIQLETALGAGSRFSVTLPMALDDLPRLEAPPPAPALDGAAVRAAIDRLGIDRNRYLELLRRFVGRHNATGRDVLAALAAGDHAAARHLAHAARGGAGMLGATEAHDAAVALEHALTEDPPRAPNVLDDAARRFAAAMSDLVLAAAALTGAARPLEETAEALDLDALRAVTAQLDRQLSVGDAAAEETLTELRALLGATASADLDALGRALDAFEFEEAQRRLKSLSTRLALSG